MLAPKHLDIATLAAVDTATLRSELANALRLTAHHLSYLAAIWKELENRGEDLSALRSGMGVYLSAIAAGRLLPEVVVMFAGEPAALRRVMTMPLDRQREVVESGVAPPKPARPLPPKASDEIPGAEENPESYSKSDHRPAADDPQHVEPVSDSGPSEPACPPKPDPTRPVGGRQPGGRYSPAPAAPVGPANPVMLAAKALPRDVAEMCAEMVGACGDPRAAARWLIAMLGEYLGPEESSPGESEGTSPAGPRLSPAELAAELEKWNALIHKAARKWHGRCPEGTDYDDVVAEVRAGWVYAGTRFDPSRGVQFPKYASKVGEDFARQFARLEHHGGAHVPRRHGYQSVRVVSADAAIGDDGETMAGNLPGREEGGSGPSFPRGFWEDATRELSEREREVILLRYRDGLTLREVGEKTGKSHQGVALIESAALARLRETRPDLGAAAERG